jgi:hypothetical protein
MDIYRNNPAFQDPQVQMQFLVLMITSVIALWVVNDARSRGKDARSAFLWGLGTLMVLPVVLVLWFFLRPKTKTSTRTTAQSPLPSSPFLRETVGTPIPEDGDKGRSKICDTCGKFYLGSYNKCPHCGAAIE